MTFDKGLGIPAELAEPSDSFIGREWALAEVASWYGTNEPLLVILAEPGVGKSALAVRLARISRGEVPSPRGFGAGWLHAWHFCQAQRFGSLNLRSVLEQIAGQLCATLPGYTEAVASHSPAIIISVNQEFTGPVRHSTAIGINQLILPDAEPRYLLDSLLRRPLSALGAQAVILLDALDETEEQVGGPQTLARLMSTLRTDPVPGLRLVLTTRNGPTAEYFSHGRQLRLQDDEPTGTHDVLTYLQTRLRDSGIADAAHVAQLIAQAADGNFLFAALAASEDAERLRLIASGECALPHGLDDLYSGFLDRQVTADPRRWREVIRPVLGLLVQSRASGFTRHQLARLTGLNQSAVDDALELCAPYLRSSRPDGPFLPFHGSLRDHLRSKSRHSVYPRESTEQIIAAFRADAADPHGVEHLLGYMADRLRLIAGTGGEHTGELRPQYPQALRELEGTVTDIGHLSARITATGIDPLLNEISALHALLPENQVLGSMRGVLGRQAHNLRSRVSGRMMSFIAQQLLYECSASGRSGLLSARDAEHEPVIATLWNAASANSRLLSHTLTTSEFSVEAMAMSADGTKTALYGVTWHGNDRPKDLQVFDTETGSTIREISPAEIKTKVRSLRFSDDGRQLVALGIDRTGVVWDLSSGTANSLPPDEVAEFLPAARPPELPSYVVPEGIDPLDLDDLVVAVTPDGRYTAVCEYAGNTVTVWDFANRIALGSFHADLVQSLAISADGRWVVVGSGLGGAHVLSPLSPTPGLSLDGHRGAVRAASLRDSHAATLGKDGDLKIWDVATGRLLRATGTTPVPGAADALALDYEAGLCVVGTTLLDLRLGSPIRPLMFNGTPCDENWRTREGARDEALPPVGEGDCPREYWPTHVNHRHGSPVSALDISPDGRRIVTGTLNGVVRVWDTDTGDLIREVTRGGHLVRSTRFTPDGSHLITVAQLGGLYEPMWLGVEKWSLDTGELAQVVWPDETHSPFPLPDDDSVAALTRDGRYLATGHRNGTVTVHDLADREQVGRLVLHGAITCLAVDGTRLLVGTATGEVTLTDMRSAPKSARA
ncbi:hypothetical protein [Streptomyces antibioticus]|uniref:hypothetical protein n=1 Tax=Streptomyces antibioticus TaxID=1890 RepID=UPI0036D77161